MRCVEALLKQLFQLLQQLRQCAHRTSPLLLLALQHSAAAQAHACLHPCAASAALLLLLLL
jgi:hypothetical protein